MPADLASLGVGGAVGVVGMVLIYRLTAVHIARLTLALDRLGNIIDRLSSPTDHGRV